MTQRFAILGHPVAHSKSPQIHAAFARAAGIDLTYERVEPPLDGFAVTVARLRAEGFRGANVTLPFKVDAFRLCTQRTRRAEQAESVNTLEFTAQGIEGDTTDGIGLVRDVEGRCGRKIAGLRVLLVGAGGAARGVAGPLLDAAPARLAIANRTLARALDIVQLYSEASQLSALTLGELPQHQFDLVINATSASLSDALPLVPPSVFASGALAYDMVYGKGQTPFLQLAASAGAQTSDGLGMLVEQAAEAFHHWHGVRPETAPVFRLLRSESPA
ncbi:MAG: shikimate dehydrogenase [Betaproteobacteria bacterium]|nr:shikimate dehydrogenase [Betaproteobacteria bacterium]